MIERVLENRGARVRPRGMIYIAVDQSVLLYSSVSWAVTGLTLKVLEGFHHPAARQITGTTATCGAGGEWEYPPVVEAMEAAGLHPIMEFIRRRQATIEEKVA